MSEVRNVNRRSGDDMIRILLRLVLRTATILSLVMFVVTAALWTRSCADTELVRWEIHGRLNWFQSGDGALVLATIERYGRTPPGSLIYQSERARHRGPWVNMDNGQTPFGWFYPGRRAYGFQWLFLPHIDTYVVRIPYAALLAATAAIPLLRAISIPLGRLAMRRRRSAARRRGLCPACRYDLRGNLSGVCPECGTSTIAAA